MSTLLQPILVPVNGAPDQGRRIYILIFVLVWFFAFAPWRIIAPLR